MSKYSMVFAYLNGYKYYQNITFLLKLCQILAKSVKF